MDQQLLPLYVRDVDWNSLGEVASGRFRNLMESVKVFKHLQACLNQCLKHFGTQILLHYCGISLDEDDEIKARQVLGCAPRPRGPR